jgi:hypothetical protein
MITKLQKVLKGIIHTEEGDKHAHENTGKKNITKE